MFQLTMLELYQKRMIWTDYRTQKEENGKHNHKWAVHVSKLGWLLIKNLWPDYTEELREKIILFFAASKVNSFSQKEDSMNEKKQISRCDYLSVLRPPQPHL